MQANAIIFDLDGTLVDSLPGIEYSIRIALRQILPNREFADLRQRIGPPIRTMFRQKFTDIDDETLDKLERTFRHSYDDAGWQKTLAYDGVTSTLARLAELGLKSFVVTNKPCISTRRILEHLQLTRFFTDIVTPDSKSPPFKSKSEAAACLLTDYSLDARQTWLIGDTEDDALAAQASGMPFLAVTFGYGKVWPAQPQHRILTHFDMLLKLLRMPNNGSR